MKTPSTYLIALLALTTVGGGALAWKQYQELVELRAGAVDKNERSELQKRIWDLEKANRELSDQLAALRAESGDADGAIAAATKGGPPPEGRGERGPGGPRGGRGNQNNPQATAIRELLAKPEVQAMIESQRKLAMEDRYGALIKGLNLSPAQADKLKTLLAERQTSMQDVMAVAREQGIDPRTDREGFQKLVTDTRNDVNNSIKALLGDDGYAQLQNYEQTGPQRALVDQINRRLANSGNQMTDAQANQLIGILAANQPQAPQNSNGGGDPGGRGGPGGGGFGGRGGDLGALAGVFMGGGGIGPILDGGGRGTAVTAAAVNAAQGVLSSAQLAALQQVQQQQQQTQQLRQLVNDTLSANQPQRGGRRGGK